MDPENRELRPIERTPYFNFAKKSLNPARPNDASIADEKRSAVRLLLYVLTNLW